MNRKRSITGFALSLSLFVFGGLCFCQPVFADGGAVINIGGAGGGGGGAGGGGGGCGTVAADSTLVECAGVSWIFYKSSGIESAVIFRPQWDGAQEVYIDAECSKHTDEGGGFWHFGRNMKGLWASWWNQSYFNENNYVQGLWNDSNTYSTSSGSWGHGSTYNQDYYFEHSWMPNNAMEWNGPAAGRLNHGLYNEGRFIYGAHDADKVNGSKIKAAWYEACSYSNRNQGTNYDCNNIPGGLRYFCYWPGMKAEMEGRATVGRVDSSVNPDTATEPASLNLQDTGYTQTTMTQTIYRIDDCPTTGCLAKLGLYIKWKTGDSDANYKVRFFRDNVWTDWANGYSTAAKPGNSNELKVQGLYDNVVTLDGQKYRWGIEKLYPGKSVCYQLEYLKNASSGDPVYVTSCAIAAGEGSESVAQLDLKVKNDGLRNKDYQSEVYAKPGDEVTFRATYNPDPQYAYDLAAPQVTDVSCNNKTTTHLFYSGLLRDLLKQECGNDWQNSFGIQRKDNSTGRLSIVPPSPYSFSSGSTEQENKTYGFNLMGSRVGSSDVGKSFDDKATLNTDGIKYTPSAIKTTYGRNNQVENVYYIQLASSSNAVLDVSIGVDSVAPNGQSVHLWDKHGGANQQWLIQKTKDGYYTLTSVNSGKALDVPGANMADGSGLNVWSQNGTCAQKWKIIDHNDGTYSFLSACNGSAAIDADNGNSANGTKVQIYGYYGGDPQRWKIIPFNNEYNNKAEIKAEQIFSNNASVKVPYNFRNTTCIYDNKESKHNDEKGCLKQDERGTVYAGENESIGFKVFVNSRFNELTNGDYATPVRNAKWKLQLCYNGGCETIKEEGGNLNDTDYKKEGNSKNISVENVSIPDIPAGQEICFRSSVYPGNSGQFTNWSDPDGNYSWVDSRDACFKVAKKPSLQVLGGNVYSSRGIETNTAVKTSLAGYKNGTYVFGSWGELGVISGGPVAGFSSGASLGYTSNDDGTPTANPGGGEQALVCKRSPLTFNNGCDSATVGSLGGANSSNLTFVKNIETDKKAFASKFDFSVDPNIEDYNHVGLNNEGNRMSGNIYYYYSGAKDLALDSGEVNIGTVQIVHSKGNVTINGNLTYSSASYRSFNDMPKLAIYAEGNVNIACNVTRIDALIISNKAVYTCYDSNDINSSINSNPLTINGAVISGSLIPNRTYGAATGINSIVPAEIINFDPSLYLWGGEQSQDNHDVNANMDVTYQKELAPRR